MPATHFCGVLCLDDRLLFGATLGEVLDRRRIVALDSRLKLIGWNVGNTRRGLALMLGKTGRVSNGRSGLTNGRAPSRWWHRSADDRTSETFGYRRHEKLNLPAGKAALPPAV